MIGRQESLMDSVDSSTWTTVSRATTIVLLVCAALALGASATAAAAECGEETGLEVVTNGNSVEAGDRILAGEAVEVTYCEDGEATRIEWEAVDGLENVVDEEAPDRYEVTFSGEVKTVDLAAGAEGVDEFDLDVGLLDIGSLDESLEKLNETTAALEAGNASLDDAESAVENVTTDKETMTKMRMERSEEIVENATVGGVAGTFAELDRLDTEYDMHTARIDAALEGYADAIEAERNENRGELRLFVGGGALAGLLVGVIAGAAVPLLAARRVEEKLKLSRNVSYDRKSALLPIVFGVLVLTAGVAILWLHDGFALLGVVL